MPDADFDDRQLVQAALRRDENAYRLLVERHAEAVQRQMRHYARDPAVAEELVQDVFTEAYFGLASYRGEAPFGHWLARIGTRRGYAFWRERDRRGHQRSLDEVPDLAMDRPAESDPGRAAAVLFGLLEELPPADRLMLTLAYLEGCAPEEIARRLGMSRVLVAVRLHRAKSRLRKIGKREPWNERLAWLNA